MCNNGQEEVRSFYIGEIIDSELAAAFHEFIKEDLIIERDSPIYIYIDSFGGCVSSALSIMNMIKSSKTKTIITTLGSCFSSATYIQMVGDVRLCYDTSVFLVHPIKGESEYATEISMQNKVNFMKELNKISKKLFFKYTNFPIKKIEQIEKEKIDFFISAEDALKFNIIDEVLEG